MTMVGQSVCPLGYASIPECCPRAPCIACLRKEAESLQADVARLKPAGAAYGMVSHAMESSHAYDQGYGVRARARASG
jgi:hypothetical protein